MMEFRAATSEKHPDMTFTFPTLKEILLFIGLLTAYSLT